MKESSKRKVWRGRLGRIVGGFWYLVKGFVFNLRYNREF